MVKFSKKAIKKYWVNDGPKLVFIILYLAANVAVFTERFVRMYLNFICLCFCCYVL